MKNILISGITGFVGSNLGIYLKDDYKINGLSRISDDKSSIYNYSGVSDLLDKNIAFVHLAGKAHDLKQSSEEKEYFEINSELTKTLFDQFLVSNCEVFIYLSSVKAVSDSVTDSLAEDYTPNPITAYGKSKLKAEKYILSQRIPANKRIYILRPCMIHGPGNKGNLNLLYKLISKGIPYPLASFENRRSFLSVENLCFAIRELIEQNNIPSGVYHIADDEALSTNELIKLIAVNSGKRPMIWRINQNFIRFLAKIGDVLKLPLNTERLNKLTESYIVDNTKIKKALGKKLPVKASEGIIRTLASFNQHIK